MCSNLGEHDGEQDSTVGLQEEVTPTTSLFCCSDVLQHTIAGKNQNVQHGCLQSAATIGSTIANTALSHLPFRIAFLTCKHPISKVPAVVAGVSNPSVESAHPSITTPQGTPSGMMQLVCSTACRKPFGSWTHIAITSYGMVASVSTIGKRCLHTAYITYTTYTLSTIPQH
jgi:hypothetical protein